MQPRCLNSETYSINFVVEFKVTAKNLYQLSYLLTNVDIHLLNMRLLCGLLCIRLSHIRLDVCVITRAAWHKELQKIPDFLWENRIFNIKIYLSGSVFTTCMPKHLVKAKSNKALEALTSQVAQGKPTCYSEDAHTCIHISHTIRSTCTLIRA